MPITQRGSNEQRRNGAYRYAEIYPCSPFMKYAKNALRIEPREYYDYAIVGVCKKRKVFIYSWYRLVAICMHEQEIKFDEYEYAVDWIEFNTISWVNPTKPEFLVTNNKKYEWLLPLDLVLHLH